MSEMLERVARALAVIKTSEEYIAARPDLAKVLIEANMPCARAAILALRNPTEEMIKAAWETETTVCGRDVGLDPEAAFQAMIDEALRDVIG